MGTPKTARCFTPGGSLEETYRVTALVSCYDSAAFLTGCLEDLLGQTLYRRNELEIIVVDSGSTQGEHAIVADYQRRWPHIRLLRTERETVYAAWNRGIQMARGRFITNANTDDAHRPDALELLAHALERHPEADLAYGYCLFTRKPNDVFPGAAGYLECRLPPFIPALGMMYCLLGPHPLWRRRVFSVLGLFDSRYRNAGDYDFQMRFIEAGRHAVLVPEVLSLFYQNPRGLSLSSEATRVESEQIEARYRARVPIDRLYAIDAADARAAAAAWVAQGNLALSWECAWEKHPQKDFRYAYQCYARALDRVPGYGPAVRNIAACLAAEGKWESLRRWAAANPRAGDWGPILTERRVPPLIAEPAVEAKSSPIFRAGPIGVPTASATPAALESACEPAALGGSPAAGSAVAHIESALKAMAKKEWDAAEAELKDSLSHLDGDREAAAAVATLRGSLGAPPSAALLEKVRTALRRLEYRALGLPEQAGADLLAGGLAVGRGDWAAALAHYRMALEKCRGDDRFAPSLEEKIGHLRARLHHAPRDAAPALPDRPASGTRAGGRSRLCRWEDFFAPEYASVCRELAIPPADYERKNWEYFFIVQSLQGENLLGEGRRGLGFGVGRERLAAYFARRGCRVLATDLEPDEAVRKAWVATAQHCDGRRDLFYPDICPREAFDARVQFAYADMNRIPESLRQSGFDFTWSCCALEHLGSIEAGMRFLRNQMACLRPGGLAVHTTEFNLSSDVLTVTEGPTVIFRRRDIEELAQELRREGHEVAVDYTVGPGSLNRCVDLPPYMTAPGKRHLRLLLWKYITTSIGLFIRKKE